MADDPMVADFPDQVREVVMANLYRLFPDASHERLQEWATRLFFNQSRASIEVGYFSELVPQVRILDDSGSDWRTRPAVFVSYHYAGYRLVPPSLLYQGAKLTIVMDRQVAENKEEKFTGALSAMLKRAGKPTDTFQFRDTSDISLILKLARDIRSGRSVLFYVDGNMGVDGKKPSESHTESLPFLGHVLHSRTGIAVLASLGRVPVIPLIMSHTESLEANTLHLLPAIWPGADRQQFVADALRRVWGHCEAAVSNDPALWESLRYANKYIGFGPSAERGIPAREIAAGDAIIFDHRRFAYRDAYKETVLFDRQEALITTVGDKLAPYIKAIYENAHPSLAEELDIPLYVLNWMHKKGMVLHAR